MTYYRLIIDSLLTLECLRDQFTSSAARVQALIYCVRTRSLPFSLMGLSIDHFTNFMAGYAYLWIISRLERCNSEKWKDNFDISIYIFVPLGWILECRRGQRVSCPLPSSLQVLQPRDDRLTCKAFSCKLNFAVKLLQVLTNPQRNDSFFPIYMS